MLEFIQKTNHKGDIQMLKTIKGKVIAGTVSVVLLSSAGAAFAASNAGANLQNWYNGKLFASSLSVASQTASYGNAEKGKFETEYAGMKTAATTSINTKADTMETSTNNSVKATADAYIDDVTSKKAEISSKMADQFNFLSTTAQIGINLAGAKALRDANDDLSQYTSAAGTAATTQMTNDINAATATAKQQLQDAINTAKNQLQAELDAETSDTVKDINAKIDAKIVELRTKITKIKDDFVLAQEQSIANAAAALETQAKADLDAIVNGIK